MAADGLDAELGGLLFKLKKIQNEVGPNKETVISVIGEDGKTDQFLTIKAQLMEHVATTKVLLQSVQAMEKTSGTNPKDLITEQSKLRQEMVLLMDEWKAMETIYRAEVKKKRSKYSAEEMSDRNNTLQQFLMEIQAIKEIQRSGYTKSGNMPKGYEAVRQADISESEAFRKPRDGEAMRQSGVHGKRNLDMSDQHRMQLQVIKDRDAELDEEIMMIGKGVDELREIALAQNEEVKLQSRMLTTLEDKINDVHENILTVNEKLKDTLEKVRDSGKICVDIACILLLVGMIIVLYELVIKE